MDETNLQDLLWPDPISVSKLEKLTGRDRRTITEILERNKIKPVRVYQNAHLYNLVEALPLIFEFGEESHIESDSETVGGLNPRLEKARLDKVRRLMLEQEFAEREGKLVPIEQLAPQLEKTFSIIKTKLMSLPIKAAQRVDSKNFASVRNTIDDLVRDALNELSEVRLDGSDQRTDQEGS